MSSKDAAHSSQQEAFDWGSTTISLKWHSKAEDVWYCQPWAHSPGSTVCAGGGRAPSSNSAQPGRPTNLLVQATSHFTKLSEAPSDCNRSLNLSVMLSATQGSLSDEPPPMMCHLLLVHLSDHPADRPLLAAFRHRGA